MQSLFEDSLVSLFGGFSKNDPHTCWQSKRFNLLRGSENLPWSPYSLRQNLLRDPQGQSLGSWSTQWWRSISLSLSSWALQIQVAESPQQPCEPTEMLIIDEDVTLVVSKQKLLQLKSVTLAPNARPRPAFLWQCERLAFTNCASQHLDARSTFHCKSMRLASSLWLRQSARSTFLFQNARPASR